MKKAVIVKAVVMTRVVIDVESNKNLTDKECNNAVELAKERLISNLRNDYYDCIESVEEDKEMPYEEEFDNKDDKLHKFFKVNNLNIISRDDYETLPCPMYAMEFTDEQMQTLANRIYDVLISRYTINEVNKYFSGKDFDNFEQVGTQFWNTMEGVACDLNMRYYEDISDEEYHKITKKLTCYKWVANSDDGAYEEESGIFDTHKECYNDMRRKALLKMEWNTDLEEDFNDGTESINYEVTFSPNQITHKSYSGLYTYKVIEIK